MKINIKYYLRYLLLIGTFYSNENTTINIFIFSRPASDCTWVVKSKPSPRAN